MQGDRVDLSHSSVKRLLERRGRALPPEPNPDEPTAASVASELVVANDDEPRTADAMVTRFGSIRNFYDFSRALTAAADARAARRKNELIDGRLVSRELVRLNLLGLIDQVFRRLLTDAARTLAANQGGTLESRIAYATDVLSSHLRAIKSQAVKALRTCKTDNPPELRAPDTESLAIRVNRRLVAELKTRMQTMAAPEAVETTQKAHARAAARAKGVRFHDAWEGRDLQAEREAIEHVAHQLGLQIDEAVRAINLRENLDENPS